LEVFTIHPDDATVLIDKIVRLSGMLDKKATDCDRVPFPTEPDVQEYLVSVWKYLRERNIEIYTERIGGPPPFSFWDCKWWEPDGMIHFMETIQKIEGPEFLADWIRTNGANQQDSWD
jgi:hypothetical protein